jgi:RNA polymerase sigma-70 factor (ECF subfamily)
LPIDANGSPPGTIIFVAAPLPDDDTLLLRWRGGDESAGSQLLRRHFRGLYRFFRPRVGDAAADLIQRTMLGCVEARDRLPTDGGFRPFLFGIARNNVLMHLRKDARHARALHAQPSAVPDVSPSGVVAHREEHRRLLRALRQLSLDDQLLVELFYWEELPLRDVAAVVEVPPATVKTRLHRARERLRDAFDALDPIGTTTSVVDLERWARAVRDDAAQD